MPAATLSANAFHDVLIHGISVGVEAGTEEVENFVGYHVGNCQLRNAKIVLVGFGVSDRCVYEIVTGVPALVEVVWVLQIYTGLDSFLIFDSSYGRSSSLSL